MEESSVTAQEPTPAPPRLSLRPVHLVLALIFGVLLGVGGYAGYQEFASIKPSTQQEVPEPSPTSADETAGWKTYTITPEPATGYSAYNVTVPAAWNQIEHSSNFQSAEKFQDPEGTFVLTIEQEKNTFDTLQDVAGVSYPLTTLTVAEAQALRLLPRAGSEHMNKVGFFTKDKKFVVFVTLETPRDGSKITEGNALFEEILSTFAFLSASQPTMSPTIAAEKIPIQATSDWKTVINNGVAFRIPPQANCNDPSSCTLVSWTSDYQGNTAYYNIRVEVKRYLGGSRREQFYTNMKPECHDIYKEARFGSIQALQIAIDGGWCQGGGGGIVAVVGQKLVIIHNLFYNPNTKVIDRWDVRDSLVSTLNPL